MAGRHNVGLDSESFKQAHELAARTNFCVGDAVGLAVRNALLALGRAKPVKKPAARLKPAAKPVKTHTRAGSKKNG